MPVRGQVKPALRPGSDPQDHLKKLFAIRWRGPYADREESDVLWLTTTARRSMERHAAGDASVAVTLIPGDGRKVSPSLFECGELTEFVVASIAG